MMKIRGKKQQAQPTVMSCKCIVKNIQQWNDLTFHVDNQANPHQSATTTFQSGITFSQLHPKLAICRIVLESQCPNHTFTILQTTGREYYYSSQHDEEIIKALCNAVKHKRHLKHFPSMNIN